MVVSYQRARILLGLMVSLMFHPAAEATARSVSCGQELPQDLIDLHGTPASASDRSLSLFFDLGSWHGYALAPTSDRDTGFVGPFMLAPENGRWANKRVAMVRLTDLDSNKVVALSANDAGGTSCPGYLMRVAQGDGITVKQTLYFADASRALVQTEITSDRDRRLALSVTDDHAFAEDVGTNSDGSVTARFAAGKATLSTKFLGQETVSKPGDNSLTLARSIVVGKTRPVSVTVEQVLHVTGDTPVTMTGTPEDVASANRTRWRGYLDHSGALAAEPGDMRVAAKAVQTLVSNWRAPRGDLRHAGLFPSYSNPGFNGFWAWDSWKHAVALTRFAPDLAKEQVRAMFDYQDEHGMIADVIYVDRAENNWRDTKPPLAAWAVEAIHKQTGDTAFVAEMFDKLMTYHRWWYANRDHDRDGLAEYGSTDGTRIAAAWESGMDNAVRFDGGTMLKNNESAWSLDQESVDLNSYLYAEKLQLAALATTLGKADVAADLRQDAKVLKAKIQEKMFNAKAGYFFDIGISNDRHVPVYGPEGWIPLWAGVATPEQAKKVVAVMMDPKRFATLMPFPTLDSSHAEFSPIKGYWRGPVWLDQAWFGVKALEKYGYNAEAETMRQRLLDSAVGLKGNAPIFENYDPLTGKGYQSPNFSWSAAHYLMLLDPTSPH